MTLSFIKIFLVCFERLFLGCTAIGRAPSGMGSKGNGVEFLCSFFLPGVSLLLSLS